MGRLLKRLAEAEFKIPLTYPDKLPGVDKRRSLDFKRSTRKLKLQHNYIKTFLMCDLLLNLFFVIN